jgi:hypothetical protein
MLHPGDKTAFHIMTIGQPGAVWFFAFRELAQLLAQVRISYVLNNARCVVTEDAPYNPYRDMTASVKYDHIVERCMSLLSNDHERQQLASEGARKFEAMPMADILANAIRL